MRFSRPPSSRDENRGAKITNECLQLSLFHHRAKVVLRENNTHHSYERRVYKNGDAKMGRKMKASRLCKVNS